MLRTATPEDAAAVALVLVESRRTFLPYAASPHTPQQTRDWVAEHLIPSGRVTVATIDNRVVAVLAMSEDESASWVDQLYVLPGFESRGLGSRLLELAHKSAKRPIRLFTFQQNAAARRFYERHGYMAIALSDGEANEEKCPDVLYELTASTDA
jgi:ribosomal protein S18 acetylase RimI-like enzyme